MIKSVNNYPISQLFDIEAAVIYAIPRYQREYTWGKGQWEALFDDVVENDPGYFLGSIICINQAVDTLALQRLEVVDGQQRLTTLSLLFAAVYQVLKSHSDALDDDQQVELINLKRKLVMKRGDELRVVPQIQNSNQADYRSVLSEIGVLPAVDVPSNAGNRRIYRAFRYFQGRLSGLMQEQDNAIGVVVDFLDKLSAASLVKIEVITHADAYTLFESLNNRGMPLTAIDLIKNKLLAQLEQSERGRVDYYFEQWSTLLSHLGDDYAVQERFFRHFYNAFREDLKNVYQVPMATRSNLIQIYEKLIMSDAAGCLTELRVAGKLYSLFLKPNQEHEFSDLRNSLQNLERIQGAPSYLLLLYLMRKRDQLQIETQHLRSVIDLLVRFFVRRNLTDIPPTRDLSRIFMNLILEASGKVGDNVVAGIANGLIAVSASDADFRAKLSGPIYDENSGVTRFILCALAEQAMTRETEVDLWKRDGKNFIWTIEHILPQGENLPVDWVRMIGNGDASVARQIQSAYAHTLGNLTISGFNSSLGNKSFAEKRDRTDRENRPVGYRNGLKLNEDLANADAWTVGQIERRTEKLIDQAMDLFRMDP